MTSFQRARASQQLITIDNYNCFLIKTLHYFVYHNHGFLRPSYIIIITLLLYYFVISAAPEAPGRFPEERRKNNHILFMDEPFGKRIN